MKLQTFLLILLGFAVITGCNRQAVKKTEQEKIKKIETSSESIAHVDFTPAEGDPGVYLFDSARTASEILSSTNLPPFSRWHHIAPDITTYTFRGDAGIINNRIVAVIRASGYGVDLYTLSKTGAVFRCTVRPVSAEKKQVQRALNKVIIHENSPAAVKLGIEYKSDGKVTGFFLKLSAGEPGVEFTHGVGTECVAVEALMPYVIVPNFFAGDMIFSASEGTDEILLPAEHMLLSLTDNGNNIIMCTWKGTNQEARCITGLTNNVPVITQIQIRSVENSPVWIMFMEMQGIWFDHTPGMTVKSWEPPFQAHWRVDFLDSLPFAESMQYTPELATTVSTKKYVVYPLERIQSTPLDRFCMRDIMKSTLGIGPCEYIVQSEKIINPDTPHEVSHWILEISRKGQALQRQEEIKQRVKNMIEHVKHVQSRIDAYASFAQSELSELEKQQSEGLKDKFQALITTLATIARRASSAGSSAGYPAQIAELSENMLKQVFGGASPETLSEFANKLSTIGETQDKAISFCRMATQWVRQLARMISPVSPEQKSLLERIVLKADSSLSAM